MLLKDVCKMSVYEKNPFCLLGLKVGMTRRKIKRRLNDLLDAGVLGENEWEYEFNQYLLGTCQVPQTEDVSELIEQLKDPEFEITSMFFWFWPFTEDDLALDAIQAGRRDEAYQIWRKVSLKSTKDALIAKHNLAILFHYYAIDAEKQRLSGEVKNTQAYLKILDSYWRMAFKYWEDIIDDDDFWDIFQDWVKSVEDPRLDNQFVNNFRKEFPIYFDNINGEILVNYSDQGKLADAKRHFTYMTETMGETDNINDSLRMVFKNQLDKIQVLRKCCDDMKRPKEGMQNIRKLLDSARPLFNVLSFLLPETNPLRCGIMDDVVKSCQKVISPYVKETEDFSGALIVEKEIFSLANSQRLKRDIQDTIESLERIIKKRRDADTCWYCKTYHKGMNKKVVKLYGELVPDIAQFGRVTYSTRQIEVPVCPRCTSRFSNQSIRDYPLIRTALNSGWKIGERPTSDEIDGVWVDVLNVLGALGRR